MVNFMTAIVRCKKDGARSTSAWLISMGEAPNEVAAASWRNPLTLK